MATESLALAEDLLKMHFLLKSRVDHLSGLVIGAKESVDYNDAPAD